MHNLAQGIALMTQGQLGVRLGCCLLRTVLRLLAEQWEKVAYFWRRKPGKVVTADPKTGQLCFLEGLLLNTSLSENQIYLRSRCVRTTIKTPEHLSSHLPTK
jgi:hypothetical protein